MLKTNRGVIKLFLLSLITLGIYSLYFVHKIAQDANIACEGDGKKTRGLLALIFLSIITLGIYGFIWPFMLVNRIDHAATKYGLKSKIGLGGYILWSWLGAIIIIGPIVAQHKFLKNMNAVCDAYNQQNTVPANS